MVTLHIEHPISDPVVWRAAFGRFAAARQQAGVRREHIRHPFDDPQYVVVDLEFDTVEEATAFRGFLETQVWTNPEASPALAGTPRTLVLTEPQLV
jgi:hypothetical protein